VNSTIALMKHNSIPERWTSVPCAEQCFCLPFLFLTEVVYGRPKKAKQRAIGVQSWGSTQLRL